MIKITNIFLLAALLTLSNVVAAGGIRIGKTLSCHSHNSTHFVKPYVNKRGIYHQPHRSANSNSGLKCSKNVCVSKFSR